MAECLLFDSDGTLVDSELLNNEALSATLADDGVVESAASLVNRYRGWNFHKVVPDLQHRHDVRLDDSFTARFRQRASEHFAQHLRPVAGIETALSRLEHPKCVVSNAPLAKIRHVMEITGLGVHFSDRLFSAYEIESWKPSPELFLHAASAMGFAADRCVVVEDSEVGVEAAYRAGIPVIQYDPTGNAQSPNATVTISSMELLPEAVAGLRRQ